MRIGILTFHRSINNGAIIQCYSLYKKILNDFPECDVEVIDYHMPKVSDKLYPVSARQYYEGVSIIDFLKKTYRLLQDPKKFKHQREKNELFNEALTNIKLSERRIISNDTCELFQYINSNYDVVIVGSDAIWNYTLRGFPNPYFLDESIRIYKLSYAASCYGMGIEDVKECEKIKIKNILNSYSFIGVRDDETALFAKQIHVNNNICHTCDPTVLLNMENLPVDRKEFEIKLCNVGFDIKKPSIGVMGDNCMCKFLKQVYGNKYQIIALFNYCKDADVNLFNITPFEWAYVFKYFKLTITTYFHGTLLSLKNQTPVLCIALNNSYNVTHRSKVEDFLKRVNLEDFYIPYNLIHKDSKQVVKLMDQLINDESIRISISHEMNREAESYIPFYNQLLDIQNKLSSM